MPAFMTALVLIAAIVAVSNLMSGGGNLIAGAARYLAIFGLLIGVLNGRMGVVYLVFASAYIELVKRTLVFSGSVSFMDIAAVLAVAPLTMLGVSLHLGVGLLLGRRKFERFDWIMVILTGIVGAAAAGQDLLVGNGMATAVQGAANWSAYIMIIPAIHLLFPSYENKIRLLSLVVICYVPVAIYGVVQHHYGFSSFERAYMLSGYTITFALLDESIVRPFSTLSSPHAFSLSMVCMMMISLMLYKMTNSTARRQLAVLGLLCFSIALCFSFARTAWVAAIIALACGFFFFRSRGRVLFFYVSSLIGLVTLVLSADYLLRTGLLLDFGEDMIGDTSGGKRSMALRLSTFSDRLYGYRNLATNPEMWSLFGVGKAGVVSNIKDAMFSHDALSGAILAFGVVPCGVVLAVMIGSLKKVHSSILAVSSRRDRHVAILGFAASVSLVITSVSSRGGSNLSVFPANLLLYICMGIALIIVFQSEEA